MGLFRRKPKDRTSPEEHAVLLHIRLGDGEFGLEREVEEAHALQDALAEAIQAADAGMLDGDEFGGGECVIYMYGPDADDLWDAVSPVLEKRPFRKGSFALRRYGGPDSPRQERVDLAWAG